MKRHLLLLSSVFLLVGCASSKGDISAFSSSTNDEASLNSSSNEPIPASSSSEEANNSSSSYPSKTPGDESSSSISIPVANYYEITMEFASGVTTKGLKQRYLEGTEVTFQIEYDETAKKNVKVIFNEVELTPTSDKTYTFTMPSKNSTMKITAEDAIKKYGFVVNASGATVSFLDNIEQTSKVEAGTSISFSAIASTGYGIKSVTVSYLSSEGLTTDVELAKNGSVYTFTMPSSDVTISVSTSLLYSVVIPSSANTGFSYSIDGGKEHAAGETVSFSITQTDPSYLFIGVFAYTDYSTADSSYRGNPITVREVDRETKKYSFEMPSKAVTLVVNANKRYKLKTEKDNNVEDIVFDNESKDYYALSDTVSFSVTYKEGYKADKVTANGNLLVASEGKYSFKFSEFSADVTIKVTSKAEGETSYWDKDTTYLYADSRNGFKEEITIHPSSETVDIIVYQLYDDEWEYESYWCPMNSYTYKAIPYTFDGDKTMTVDHSTHYPSAATYVITFVINDGEAVSLTIDTSIYSGFSTLGKTFTRQ